MKKSEARSKEYCSFTLDELPRTAVQGVSDYVSRGKYGGMGVLVDDDPSAFEPEPVDEDMLTRVREMQAAKQIPPEEQPVHEEKLADEKQPEHGTLEDEKPVHEKPVHEKQPEQLSQPAGAFHELYTSRDGGLVVYETKDGHIISVAAARLA